MAADDRSQKKVTIHTLQQNKQSGRRSTMVTAYDATFARLFDQAGVDCLLVGDSVGMVVQGHDTTLPVTLDEMVYHCRAVRRGTRRALVVGDLPFGTYQAGIDDAVRASVRLVAEGGAESVKLEGGADFAPVIEKIVRAGIPVFGHLGLTPQSVHRLGGYVVQGRGDAQAARLLADAQALESAGCCAVVLEAIPVEVAEVITRSLRIPTIGIGAGAACDGQVLVGHDLLGLNPDFSPRFVRKFIDGAALVDGAARTFVAAVQDGTFPAEEHTFHRARRAAG